MNLAQTVIRRESVKSAVSCTRGRCHRSNTKGFGGVALRDGSSTNLWSSLVLPIFEICQLHRHHGALSEQTPAARFILTAGQSLAPPVVLGRSGAAVCGLILRLRL